MRFISFAHNNKGSRQLFGGLSCIILGVDKASLTAPSYKSENIISMSYSQGKADASFPSSEGNVVGASVPAHHIKNTSIFGPRFQNPWDTHEERSLIHVWKWHREKRKSGITMEPRLVGKPHPTEEDFCRAFPLNPVDWKALAAPLADGVQAVWIGHATVLVQMGGLNFITDPVFSQRCAPVQFAGPKRVVAPALTCTEPQMPRLDFVLLSHNHYDHLDTHSVRTLHRQYGKALTWYVPLGLRTWFASEGVVGNVVEMDWWQSVKHTNANSGKSVTITMVPAQHWSARGILDRFRTLWGGYVVATSQQPSAAAKPGQEAEADKAANGKEAQPAAAAGTAATADGKTAARAPVAATPMRFYFAGDTGYCPVFKEIGARLGPIDLAAIPIGAYEPRWFMKPQHTNPEEGLQIALDVRAAVSIGIHTATWSLTDEPLDEPPARLQAAVQERGLPESSFVTLQHGEMAVVRGGKLENQPKTLPVPV
ncbi:hypothetical protein Vretimale_9252 [Volvox reticuliferus]|uniref:Metallo-beta-lactamase domain-containing protein n=2 Tax=Volvox reticuliferus TaxID=1737510 RepID=A0A8J4CG66_9CHLO|nr:hypothetical protein Vretifemale_10175 [Volvox reticuliferus]GIM04759.1 hypothetical protein Vretimale_9252 [Volvox reticuliferus]